MTTTLPAPTHTVTRAASALRREITLFRLAILAIALHAIDDSFIQPQPGTSAGDHLVSGLLDEDSIAINRALNFVPQVLQTASQAVFSNQAPPTHLKDLVERVAPRPLLLIAAPNSPNGEDLNRDYHAGAGENSTLWEIPESDHLGGLDARPQEYERRVVGFFDEALR